MTMIGQAFGALVVALQTPGSTGTLTIDEAISMAEKNAFAIAAQLSTIEKNHQKISEAKGGLGPKLNSTATYLRYDEAQTSNFGGQSFVTQPVDNKTVAASLTMPIDISGNLHRLIGASIATEKASKFTLQQVYNDLRLSVRTAYYAVLRAQASVGVQEQALKDAKERLNQANAQLKQDVVAKIDVKRFEAQVAQSVSDLLSAQNTLQLTKNSLNYAIARPIDTPLDVVDVAALPSVDVDLAKSIEAAQMSRPEILAAKTNLEALGLVRRAQEAGLNPSLNFGVNFSRNLDPQQGAKANTMYGTLTLSVPIFDSGVTRAKVRGARQDEKQVQIQLEQAKLGISQDVRSAITTLASAKARLANAESQVSLAEEVFRLAGIKRDAQEGTYVEVIDAETQLTQARNGRVAARYDYLTAFAQLQRALGRDDVMGGAK